MSIPRFSLPDFYPGDHVIITEGTFEAFEGRLGDVDLENGKLTVLIEIFGRITPVEVEQSKVRRRPLQ